MFVRYIFCLTIGLIIGVYLTDFWNYIKIQNFYDDCKHLTKSKVSNSEQISLSDYLFNDTRVLCWIMTSPENHLKRAIHVKNTWGSRCNKLLFMSSEDDQLLETVRLPVPEGREYLWEKTRTAFRYVYDHHFNDAEWFLKADDDTYVIMENLRIFLYQFSADAPVYFGCKFKAFVKQPYLYGDARSSQRNWCLDGGIELPTNISSMLLLRNQYPEKTEYGYMSGGAGYVLSKEALSRFAEIAYTNSTMCSQTRRSEDIQLGICLQNIGVIAGDSRDEKGQERFIPLGPVHLIPIDTSSWYAKYLFYKPNKKLPCCSRTAISFHYTKPKEFYTLDYFLYGLRSFENTKHTLPPKANMTKLMKIWKKEIRNDTIL